MKFLTKCGILHPKCRGIEMVQSLLWGVIIMRYLGDRITKFICVSDALCTHRLKVTLYSILHNFAHQTKLYVLLFSICHCSKCSRI